MNDKEKNMLVESLNDYKRFVHSQQFYYELYRMDMKTMCDSCYSSVVYQARSIGMIDDFEYNKLEQIGQIVKDNCDGIVSNDELKRCIMAIDDEAKEYYGSTNSNDGQTLAITLSIAFASIEWWEENPDAFGDINNSKVLPAWVGADIAGAAYGAIVSGVGSYVTTGSVNWGGVGISAAAGAISGSTGIIGKAGKWLTNLF